MIRPCSISRRLVALVLAMPVALAGQQGAGEGRRAPDALIAAGQYDEAEDVARAQFDALRASAEETPEVWDAADALVRARLANGRPLGEDDLSQARRTLEARRSRFGPDTAESVPTLINLADVLAGMARFEQAVTVARRAVAIERRSGDGVDAARAFDHLGRALSGARRFDEATTTLEQSLALKEKTLPPGSVEIARTLEDIALVLQRRGRYDRAGTVIRRAAAIQEATEPRHPAYATTLNLLAQQLWFEGAIQASKTTSEDAVRVAQQHLRPDHPVVTLALRYLAATLFDLGDSASCRALTERALALAERNFGATHHVTADYLNDLGVVEKDEGDYPAARRHLRRSLELYEAAYGRSHELVATSLSALALVDARMGDYARARQEQARAAEIHARVGGVNHPFVAKALTELAAVYRDQGRPLEAIPLLERALTIREQNLGSQHRDVAVTLASLAAVLSETGRLTRARALADRAVGIWEGLGVPDAPDYATGLMLSASLQARRGEFSVARTQYQRALEIRSRVFGIAHPLYGEAQSGLGEALLRLGDREAALTSSDIAERVGRDHLRLMLRSLPERDALYYAAARPRGINVLLSLVDSTDAAVRPAIETVIRGRAIVLDEVAARQSAAKDEPARNVLRSSQQRLANLVVRGPGALSPAQYAVVVEDARRERDQAEQALVESSATYRAERARDQISLDEVAGAIPGDAALVSFVLYSRQSVDTRGAPSVSRTRTVPAYLAFVLRAGTNAVAVPLGSASATDALVAQWRADIAADASTIDSNAQVSRRSGAALRSSIWDPVALHLAGVNRVFLVPDGALSLVPFAALPVGRRSYVLESGPAIHYLSAERDLVHPVGAIAEVAPKGLLALGGPAFGDRALPYVRDDAGIPRAPISAAAPCSLQAITFPPLEGTLEEVRDVARLWSSAATSDGLPRADMLVGRQAGESVFKKNGPSHRVLHLATHGFFLDGDCAPRPTAATRGVGGLARTRLSALAANPLRLSGLALAGANRRAEAKPDEDDGILTAEEVASLDLSGTEWAVLSACDTGVGEIKAGEGVFGLRRAFQVAGARTVIMSLWSVEDQSTRAWMRALYEGRFQRHLSTADAVHQASLTVLRDRRARGLSTHPFFWAAFVAAGDWR